MLAFAIFFFVLSFAVGIAFFGSAFLRFMDYRKTSQIEHVDITSISTLVLTLFWIFTTASKDIDKYRQEFKYLTIGIVFLAISFITIFVGIYS